MVPGPRAVVVLHHRAVGQRHRGDLARPEAVLLTGARPLLRARGEAVHLLARHALGQRHVLGGLPHRDVRVGEQAVGARVVPLGRPGGGHLGRARLGVGEQRVVRAGQVVGAALVEPRDGLDAGGEEDVALAGADGVRGHARGLHRRRAVPRDRRARQGVHPELDGDDAGEVVALLAAGQAAAEQEVLDLGRVEGGDGVERGAHHLRGEVVGAHPGQRALAGAADRRADGGHDDGLAAWGDHGADPTTAHQGGPRRRRPGR